MRTKIAAIAVALFCAAALPAAAKSDTGLSAGFATYLKNRVHSETIVAKRELSHAEICGVIFRAAESFKQQYEKNSGKTFERQLTYQALVEYRTILRDCERHKKVKPLKFKEGMEPAVVNVEDMGSGGVRNIEDPEDDSLEAEALRDFMKWHPDEFEAKSAQQAGQFAELACFVSEENRDLKAQLDEAKAEARQARDQVQFAHNRGESAGVIQQLIAAAQEAEGKVFRLTRQIKIECDKKREAAIAEWVKKNAPQGTAEDMSPKTSSGATRRYADADGNRVVEYDNGAKSIAYPDGREETVEPDGTRIIEHPDGHVVRVHPDGTIECLKDHPDGVLRIVVKPDGETDYYLNGVPIAHYWPDWFPDRLVRHIDYIDPETGLSPVERYSPMRRFWHWLRDNPGQEENLEDPRAGAGYLLERLAEFKKTHPGVLDDETYDEFDERRYFELEQAHQQETGRDFTEEEKREAFRRVLTEWEAAHPDETLSLKDLIAKREREAGLRDRTLENEIPLGLDVERLKEQLQAYNDWLERHPNPTQDEERERRQEAARLRQALKFQRDLFEGVRDFVGGEDVLRKLWGDERFEAAKAAYESLPLDLPDDKVGGSVDPLDPNWSGPKPRRAEALFSSLDGVTRVNGALTGPIETLVVVGVDDRQFTPDRDQARTQDAGGDLLLQVSPALQAKSVILTGRTGTVVLNAADGAAPGRAAISPLDGILDVRNARISETLRVPQTTTDTFSSAAAHKVYLSQGAPPTSQPPVGTIAVREGEIAVYGQNVDAPAFGSADCAVEGPAGETVVAELPAWGYDIQPQPVAAVNAWAPIFLRLSGLRPDQKVRVSFFPSEAVDIEPDSRTVRAGNFLVFDQVAQWKTSVIGPQPIDARIEPID